jgi:thioredoxin 1
MSRLVALGMDSFFDFISTGVRVIDFYAEWCHPCQQMLKILPNLAEKLDGQAVIGKVNVDQSPELKDLYGIKGIPLFMFFKDGKEVHRHAGVMRLAEIEARVKELNT